MQMALGDLQNDSKHSSRLQGAQPQNSGVSEKVPGRFQRCWALGEDIKALPSWRGVALGRYTDGG